MQDRRSFSKERGSLQEGAKCSVQRRRHVGRTNARRIKVTRGALRTALRGVNRACISASGQYQRDVCICRVHSFFRIQIPASHTKIRPRQDMQAYFSTC